MAVCHTCHNHSRNWSFHYNAIFTRIIGLYIIDDSIPLPYWIMVVTNIHVGDLRVAKSTRQAIYSKPCGARETTIRQGWVRFCRCNDVTEAWKAITHNPTKLVRISGIRNHSGCIPRHHRGCTGVQSPNRTSHIQRTERPKRSSGF